MEAGKAAAGRAYCPSCGQKYAVPEEELKRRPGLRFRATCRACETAFSVQWRDGALKTDVEEILEEAAGERDVLPRGARVGKYEIDGLIDSGGSSSVYKAFDPGANRYVALKLLHKPADSDYGVRFRREVEVQANLKHPNLMPIFDQGSVDGKPYYTMELLHKPTTLDTIVGLFRSGRLDFNAALRSFNSVEALVRGVLLPVARAIQFANVRHGIIHRDLKPENVIVDARTLRVYVIDFGICHVTKDAGSRLFLRAGAETAFVEGGKNLTLGTVRFMPPEQARGEVSPHGDVWALGALLYFLVSGEFPIARALDLNRVNLEQRIRNLEHVAESCRASGDVEEAEFYEARLAELRAGEMRTIKDVLRDAQEAHYVPLPASTDPALAAAVRRAMAKEPGRRYPDAESFAQELQAWLDGRPVRAYSASLRGTQSALYT
ncbi:MAG: protein kinase domain-containing protein, partial [Planctomycetota bacterium]